MLRVKDSLSVFLLVISILHEIQGKFMYPLDPIRWILSTGLTNFIEHTEFQLGHLLVRF